MPGLWSGAIRAPAPARPRGMLRQLCRIWGFGGDSRRLRRLARTVWRGGRSSFAALLVVAAPARRLERRPKRLQASPRRALLLAAWHRPRRATVLGDSVLAAQAAVRPGGRVGGEHARAAPAHDRGGRGGAARSRASRRTAGGRGPRLQRALGAGPASLPRLGQTVRRRGPQAASDASPAGRPPGGLGDSAPTHPADRSTARGRRAGPVLVVLPLRQRAPASPRPAPRRPRPGRLGEGVEPARRHVRHDSPYPNGAPDAKTTWGNGQPRGRRRRR